jgi:hypothetical protein
LTTTATCSAPTAVDRGEQCRDATADNSGMGRWKRLQRLNYALFALVIPHAFL